MVRGKKGPTFPLFGSGELEESELDASEGDGPEYVADPADGLPAEIIKPHSQDKHLIVANYVDICRGVRGRWMDGGGAATYVDLFCGPGRVYDRSARHYSDG